MVLYGREAEHAAVAALLARAWAGQGGALLVRGAAGIGKSELLAEAARRARTAGSRVRVLRTTGTEAESVLPFAGLHLLLRPVLTEDRLASLPAPQANALRGAFGLAEAAPEDRFRIGLAVLTLLSDLAVEQPLLCLVDDVQWLDPSSAEALLFTARRLGDEPVALLLAARDDLPDDGQPSPVPGVPELRLGSLAPEAAAELLADRAPDLADAVRAMVVERSDGHPLSLVETVRALTPEQRAGSAPIPAELPVPARLLESYGARVRGLGRARTALLVAAAESGGELRTVRAAARALGAEPDDLRAAERAGLVTLTGAAVAFRHPLIRAAAYQGADPAERMAAHRALAEADDSGRDPYRTAWHLAAAASGPDEEVAARLDRAGESAWERGAFAASAAAHRRASELSPLPLDRARRLLSAAQVSVVTGRIAQADGLARQAMELTEDRTVRAWLGMVRGAVEDASGNPRTAAYLLLDHAEPLAGRDPGPVVPMLMLAARSAWAARDEGLIGRVAEVAGRVRPEQPVTAALAALAGLVSGVGTSTDSTHDLTAPMASLRFFVDDVRGRNPDSHLVRLLAIDCAALLGDDDAVLGLATAEAVRCLARSTVLSLADVLRALGDVQWATGRLREAAATAAEAEDAAGSTADAAGPGGPLPARRLTAVADRITARAAALAGDEEKCRAALERSAGDDSTAVLALLDLGLGRPEQALRRFEDTLRGGPAAAAALLPFTGDLVEAAVRAGLPGRATGRQAAFTAWADAAGQPWAEAVALRCAALTGPEEAAEERYSAALERHREAGRPFEEARTELLFGEWLRRARRRTEARPRLRNALEAFECLGAVPWAERARGELRAVGETASAAPAARPDPLAVLTPQERQVVRLAAAGTSNRDIAARLFLSPRTVEYHLYKAYPKLGVGSRRELAALADGFPGRLTEVP
ncbi:AAA family ATPase [Streptomyces sp. AV19]|uniref:helix-turn-helix transcriptional regulator n=1 Tax=Streptomyces sp. AV19 TaxID=2793068 RepID=UPI0018FF0231|nr:LuxR family transcriptional regulator [Streptomyces sp. AV19]MBH1939203.1 AAA family ATPase [Streptomyces sp. AV19]MDG4530927.1 LuxR family transcriptional regulator [Streptomyces sp. AV19]